MGVSIKLPALSSIHLTMITQRRNPQQPHEDKNSSLATLLPFIIWHLPFITCTTSLVTFPPKIQLVFFKYKVLIHFPFVKKRKWVRVLINFQKKMLSRSRDITSSNAENVRSISLAVGRAEQSREQHRRANLVSTSGHAGRRNWRISASRTRYPGVLCRSRKPMPAVRLVMISQRMIPKLKISALVSKFRPSNIWQGG